MLLWLSLIFVCPLTIGVSPCNQLVAVTECICPGHSVIYQCSVMGGVVTVYQGTAFQCIGSEIALRNVDFGTDRQPAGECNSGQINITGQGISQMSNCFTSQLNISLSEGVSERTVTCAVENDMMELIPIDHTTLAISTGPFEPPANIFISMVESNSITFTWEPVSRHCPSLYYNVTSVNCGTCPNKTDVAIISCNIVVPANGQAITCELKVQTVVCGGTSAALSGDMTSISIKLKVPNATTWNITPYYGADGDLKGLNTAIQIPTPFFISDSVDGSPLNFTITFADNNGKACSPPIYILRASCIGEICSHYSDSTVACRLAKTFVSVFATSVLGNGVITERTIDYENNFVRIIFAENHERVRCIFNTAAQGNKKSCEISIASDTSCQQYDILEKKNGEISSNDPMIIIIDIGELQVTHELCYSVTASDGIQQVVEQDLLMPTGSNGAVVAGLSIALVLCITVIILFMVGTVITIILYCVKRNHKQKTIMERRSDVPQEPSQKQYITKEGRCIKDFVSEDYDSLLGFGYYEPDELEKLLPNQNIMVRDKNGRYHYGKGVVDVFVDKNRRIRRHKCLCLGYRVFLQSRSEYTPLRRGSDFVLCEAYFNGSADIKEDLSSFQGLIRLDWWYRIHDVKERIMVSQICEHYGRKVDDHEIFYNDCSNIQNLRQVLQQVKVFVVNQNDDLFEDCDKTLAKAALQGRTVKTPKGYKHLFFQSLGEKSLKEGTNFMLYDRSVIQVNKPHYEIHRESDELDIELNTGYVYQQYQVKDNLPRKPFMALRKDDHQLFTGSNAANLTTWHKDELEHIFVQQLDSLHPGARVLVCKYERHT